MKENMGRVDQLVRLGISFLLIYIGFFSEGLIQDSLSSNIIGAFGTLNLIAALMKSCPMYAITGISTCKKKR